MPSKWYKNISETPDRCRVEVVKWLVLASVSYLTFSRQTVDVVSTVLRKKLKLKNIKNVCLPKWQLFYLSSSNVNPNLSKLLQYGTFLTSLDSQSQVLTICQWTWQLNIIKKTCSRSTINDLIFLQLHWHTCETSHFKLSKSAWITNIRSC